MKFVFYLFIVSIIFTSCTLNKNELFQEEVDKNVTLDYTIAGDTAKSEYIAILLKDTTDLYNQQPISFSNTSNFLISPDTLKKGFWVLLKKWKGLDVVYESKPIFISAQIPESSQTMHIKLKDNIQVKARNVICEVKNVSFDIYGNWDINVMDDAVSDPLPDVYIKLDNFFASGCTDYVDQPYGRFTYMFNNTFVPSSQNNVNLFCYDYDFNVSKDDLMYSFVFVKDKIDKYYSKIVSDKGISKDILSSTSYYYDFNNKYYTSTASMLFKMY